MRLLRERPDGSFVMETVRPRGFVEGRAALRLKKLEWLPRPGAGFAASLREFRRALAEVWTEDPPVLSPPLAQGGAGRVLPGVDPDRPALPVRTPGAALKQVDLENQWVTVRVPHPEPHWQGEGLGRVAFFGPGRSAHPLSVTVYEDGAVDTCQPLEFPTADPTRIGVAPPSPDVMAKSPVVRALEARQAALAGRGDLVEPFTTEVLGLWRGARWQEAVSTALLGEWVEPLQEGRRLDGAALERLRADARAAHRQLTPVWRRRTQQGRVLLLDTPLGDGLTLHDLIASVMDTVDEVGEVEPDNVRLAALVRALLPAEQKVALAWAEPGVATWADAARQAGASNPDLVGERVRRKVRRLAAERERRVVLRSQCQGVRL